jgi:sterol desaturase/sphingolipid hydroxylase (fatty acid hydroxylase superfamily)
LFHHSNLRLPENIDKALRNFIVTPRLHGIHHSVVRAETDSNWSSGLTVWDKLHGTFRDDVPPGRITIGVPAYQNKDEVVLSRILPLPFEKQKNDWRLAKNQPPPERLK